MSERAPRYTAFALIAGGVYLVWLAVLGIVTIGLMVHLLDITDLEDFFSSVAVHTMWLYLGRDLIYTTFAIPLVIAIRRMADWIPRVPIWIDVAGAAAGLGLVVGFVYYDSMVLSGWLPPMGVNPNSWPGVGLYSVILFAVLAGIRVWLVRRSHGGSNPSFGGRSQAPP